MTKFKVKTKITAPLQIVFTFLASFDVHQKSVSPTKEIAFASMTSGLINLNETVTWRGKHFVCTSHIKVLFQKWNLLLIL